MQRGPRRLLTIGHSYVVGLNRRLAWELARAGGHGWQVACVAPSWYHGDLGSIRLFTQADEPARLVPVPVYGSRAAHLMAYGPKLRRVLGADWDVVHCWEEPYILAAFQVAGWTSRSARLVYASFQNIDKQYLFPFSCFERYALARSAGWIAFGQTAHETLRARRGYADRPSRVISPGVDVDHFCPDSTAGRAVRRSLGWLTDGPPVVGYLGRFVPAKGLRFLCRVLDALTVPWRALFLGDGPLHDELVHWAGRYGERVRVRTRVSHEAVPAYLNAVDVLCAPSQTTRRWREQFGRMLIESFACGVPVLASTSGEIPHVVADAGVCLAESDESAWVQTVSRLLSDPGARRELAERGRARACARFAWPTVAQGHLDFFESLLELRGNAAHGLSSEPSPGFDAERAMKDWPAAPFLAGPGSFVS